jgi:hypothetical protein
VPPLGPGGITEVVVVIIGAIVGILLGWRFKAFVLLPAILVAAGVIIITGHDLKVIALTLLSTVVVLQIGYFVGAFLRASTQPDSLPDPKKRPEDSTGKSGKCREAENRNMLDWIRSTLGW